MNVAELFRNLSYGELINLKIGMDGEGSIEPSAQSRILNYAEQALEQIYVRFSHNRDYVTLKLAEGVKTYDLTQIHAATNTDETNTALRYILDTEDNPFTGRLLKILAVKDLDDEEDEFNQELLLNSSRNPNAIELLSYNRLHFKTVVADRLLSVELSLRHKAFPLRVDPTFEIELHPALNDALCKLIAAKVYAAMNGQENAAKAANLTAEAEMIFQRAEAEDLLQLSTSNEAPTLRDRGFI